MKKILLVPFLVLFLFISCKKEPVISQRPATILIPDTPQLPPVNPGTLQLTANAGPDLRIALPVNSCILKGSSNYAKTYSWRKVSGPSSYTIDSPQSAKINVTNLEKELYEFELTVTAGASSAKDTVSIEVHESNEYIFRNLEWIFPWYSAIEVKNIDTYIQANRPIKKVFVQREFDSTWIEVDQLTNNWTNQLYEYFIETRPYGAGMYSYGSLYIFYYGNDTTDKPKVKIQF